MCLSAWCFAVFLDCRCFPADFHLGSHPALGLSLKRGASFLQRIYCVSKTGTHLARRACVRNSDDPTVVGLCGTVSNPTLHLEQGGCAEWGHDCAEDVRRILGNAPAPCLFRDPLLSRAVGVVHTYQSPRRIDCCLCNGA